MDVMIIERAPNEPHDPWACPVCEAEVPRPHRAGRQRVYCANSCRQKAYRWRRDHRSTLTTPTPPLRARTFAKNHALRSDADFVAARTDPNGRRVTACGAFATSARDEPHRFRHLNFYASDNGSVGRTTCASCCRLLNVPIRPFGETLDIVNQLPRRRMHLAAA